MLSLITTYFYLASNIQVKPKVTGIDREENYTYTWYIMPYGLEVIKTADTICRAKDLEWYVNSKSRDYTMVFEIKDKRTGVFVNKEMKINVMTEFSKGWYILKNDGGKTELDFVLPDGTVKGDVLKNISQTQVEGSPVCIHYLPSYSQEVEQPDGSVKIEKLKAAFVLGKQDMKIFNADDFTLLKDFENAFYNAPAVRAPQWCSSNYFLLNAGKLHSIYNNSANVGKFGLPWAGDYEFYPAELKGSRYWDIKSCSFMAAGDSYNTAPVAVSEPALTSPVQLSPNQMKAEMVAAMNTYALMKSTDSANDKYFLVGITGSKGAYPFRSYTEVPANSRLIQAKVRLGHLSLSSIYFAQGNELWLHSVSEVEHRERKLFAFPTGEEIAYIVQVSWNDIISIDPLILEPRNYLDILTNSAAGWKLYRMEFDSGTSDVLPIDKETASGKGQSHFVLYRRS